MLAVPPHVVCTRAHVGMRAHSERVDQLTEYAACGGAHHNAMRRPCANVYARSCMPRLYAQGSGTQRCVQALR